jgi:uncharacterized protein YecE (DUF72 family)
VASNILIGCAGWTIPKDHRELFPAEGSHLERYAGRLPAVEINSSFYRPHKPATYARWSATVPEYFAFAVKMPRAITHEQRLEDAGALVNRFLDEIAFLGVKRGPVLVQTPPSLAFDPAVAAPFLEDLRARLAGPIVCEPRHASWFAPEVEELLARLRIARVAADPAVTPTAAKPGGWTGLVYYRLHGSPDVYYSPYSDAFLAELAGQIREHQNEGAPVWCIFDNTARGAATTNALALSELVK